MTADKPADSIQTFEPDESGNWQIMMQSALLCLAELCVLFLSFFLFRSLTIFMVFHILIVACLGYWLYVIATKGRDLRRPLLLFISLLEAGPIGTAGFMVFCLLYPVAARHATPFSVWLEEIFLQGPTFGQTAFERIKAGWDDYSQVTHPIPFIDIFHYGTLYQKQAILDTIVKDFDPIYVPLLKLAADDKENTLRMQAAAIIAKINQDFENKLKKLNQEAAAKKKSSAVDLKFAQLFDAHAYSGLLSPYLAHESQMKALSYYTRYLNACPGDGATWLSKGRLLFRLQHYSEAIALFVDYEQRLGPLPFNALGWYLETLYHLKDYSGLSALAKTVSSRLADSDRDFTEIVKVIDTWKMYGSKKLTSV